MCTHSIASKFENCHLLVIEYNGKISYKLLLIRTRKSKMLFSFKMTIKCIMFPT